MLNEGALKMLTAVIENVGSDALNAKKERGE